MMPSITEPGGFEFPIPTDVDGFWQFDRVHAPRPLTPLSQDLLLPAFGDGMTAALQEMAYPHRFAMRAVNNFAYLGLMPTDPTEPYLLLHGFPTRALDSSRGLWRLCRLAAASPALAHGFRNPATVRLAEVLARTAEGTAFVRELCDYLETFGWRNDAVFELADPMWREEPTRPLAAIQGQLAVSADADPDAQ